MTTKPKPRLRNKPPTAEERLLGLRLALSNPELSFPEKRALWDEITALESTIDPAVVAAITQEAVKRVSWGKSSQSST